MKFTCVYIYIYIHIYTYKSNNFSKTLLLNIPQIPYPRIKYWTYYENYGIRYNLRASKKWRDILYDEELNNSSFHPREYSLWKHILASSNDNSKECASKLLLALTATSDMSSNNFKKYSRNASTGIQILLRLSSFLALKFWFHLLSVAFIWINKFPWINLERGPVWRFSHIRV